jgi:hypothetical protein
VFVPSVATARARDSSIWRPNCICSRLVAPCCLSLEHNERV